MRRISFLTTVLAVVFSTTLMSAQASRTWVSGVGDDANPCSRTAPCKTFAGAISKTAAGGEIDALDPAGYGAVTITKAITIDGGGGQVASVLVSGTNGIVVQAGPSDVVILRNLRINGIGTGINGIRWLAGRALHIESCNIFGFTNNGIDIAKSDGGRAFVDNTVSTDNGRSGLEALNTASTVSVSVDGSRFYNNGQFGIFARNFSKFSVQNSEASGNGNIGYIAQSTAGNAEMNIVHSTAANNVGIGIQAGGGTTLATVRIGNVASFGNPTGILVGVSGSVLSFTNTNFNSSTGAPSGTVTPQ